MPFEFRQGHLQHSRVDRSVGQGHCMLHKSNLPDDLRSFGERMWSGGFILGKGTID